jgi:hypothetical protein
MCHREASSRSPPQGRARASDHSQRLSVSGSLAAPPAFSPLGESGETALEGSGQSVTSSGHAAAA